MLLAYHICLYTFRYKIYSQYMFTSVELEDFALCNVFVFICLGINFYEILFVRSCTLFNN